MLKKIITLFLAISILIPCIGVSKASAEETQLNITAPSALLMDYETGKVLYEKNSHEIRPCASITKVMTLCLIFEAIESGKFGYDTIVTTSPFAAAMGGSDIWLVEGEQMSVNDLIKAIVVVSANDAAVAMAECVSGSEDAFVAEMNKKASELGMNDTTFKNCNGLDEDGHVTSAFDVALMSRELMKHEEIYNYTTIWLDYIRDGATQLVNTNKLLKTYDGITGLKTGTTSKAGACISATAQRNGLNLIGVVLGAENTADRFTDAAALLNYGFANYSSAEPKLPDEKPESVQILKGMSGEAALRYSVEGKFLMKKGTEENIVSKIKIDEEIEAPVSKGQQLGKIIYTCNDEILGEYPIVSTEDIKEINFKDVFVLLFDSFISF
ncbi:MAG: D-alanyl-D-alanine carboxypeptidase [Clostridia bacterium]|nr:D-alanyl-D-alanine carboxypeptidase [Clostridia bacterium]